MFELSLISLTFGFVQILASEDIPSVCAKVDGSDIGGRRIGVKVSAPKK